MKLNGIGAMALTMALAACGGGSDNTPVACGTGVAAHTLSGTASAVHDGDNLTLTHSTGTEQVRLQGIDAPELAQDWGSESRAALQGLALQVKHQTLAHIAEQTCMFQVSAVAPQ